MAIQLATPFSISGPGITAETDAYAAATRYTIDTVGQTMAASQSKRFRLHSVLTHQQHQERVEPADRHADHCADCGGTGHHGWG